MLPSDLWLSRPSVSYPAASRRKCSTSSTGYKRRRAGVPDSCTRNSRRNGAGITKSSTSSNSNRTFQHQCCLSKATSIKRRIYHQSRHHRHSNKAHGRASSTLFYAVPTFRRRRIHTKAITWLLYTSLRNPITASIDHLSPWYLTLREGQISTLLTYLNTYELAGSDFVHILIRFHRSVALWDGPA